MNSAREVECFYCGVLMIRHGPAHTHDHVIPRSRGGGNDKNNLVDCCRWCNGKKGNKPWHAFIVELSEVRQAIVLRELQKRGIAQ